MLNSRHHRVSNMCIYSKTNFTLPQFNANSTIRCSCCSKKIPPSTFLRRMRESSPSLLYSASGETLLLSKWGKRLIFSPLSGTVYIMFFMAVPFILDGTPLHLMCIAVKCNKVWYSIENSACTNLAAFCNTCPSKGALGCYSQ